MPQVLPCGGINCIVFRHSAAIELLLCVLLYWGFCSHVCEVVPHICVALCVSDVPSFTGFNQLQTWGCLYVFRVNVTGLSTILGTGG
jgi:hypothetical protein